MTELRTPPSNAWQRAGRVAGGFAALAITATVVLALVVGNFAEDGDSAWTVFLFVVALALPLWCCFRRSGVAGSARLDLFQPGAVVAAIFYFYTVVPAFHVWHDLNYQSAWLDPTWPARPLFRFAFFLSLLGLVAFGLGYRFGTRGLRQTVNASTLEEMRAGWPRSATAAAIVMLTIGFPFRMYHLAAFGGLTRNIFLFLSPVYQVESGIEIGGVPTLLESFFDWGALLLLLRATITNRHRVVSLCVLSVALVLAYLVSGKRSAVVPFLLYPVVWLHYLKQRISLKRGLAYVTAGSLLVTALLFMRTIGPLFATTGVRLTDVPADVALAPVQFYINSPELAVFDMTMLTVQDRASLLHEIGGAFWGGLRYNFLPVVYIVPRVLWPGKPIYSNIGTVFYQHAVGGREDVGFAVGIVAGLYLFGGLLGVLVGMMTVGVLFRVIYERLEPWNRDPRRVFVYGIVIWMMFHFLRFGDLGGTIVYFYQFVLPGAIVALLVLRARRRVGTTATAPEPR